MRPGLSVPRRTIEAMHDDAQPVPENGDEPEADEQQSLRDPSEDPTSLRELMRAAEAGEPVSLPPDVVHAMVEMQKGLARALTPYLELQKHLVAMSLAPALRQMADAVKAVSVPPSGWPAAAKAAAELAAAYKPIIELSDTLQQQMATALAASVSSDSACR